MRRALLVGAGAAALLYACTLTRNLDYLTNGGPDGGASGNSQTSTSSSGNQQSSTTSSGSSSSGAPATLVGDVIAPKQFAPANLVQDATNIYWTTDDNAILALAKSAPIGTAPTQLTKLDGAVEQIVQAVVDSSPTGSVFVLLESGVIQVVPKAGGTPTELASIAAPMDPDWIAVDDTNVYLLASSDPNNADQALLFRYAKTAPANQTQLSAVGTAPTTMIATSDSLFWAVTDDAGDFVMEQLAKTAPTGTVPTQYANTLQDQGMTIGIAPTAPYELGVNTQTLFWLDDSEGKAYTQPLSAPSGKATALLAEQGTDTFYAIATDGTNVYVTTSTATDASAVLRVKIGATTPDSLSVQPNPTEIIVDDTFVYVAFQGSDPSGADGGILRIAK